MLLFVAGFAFVQFITYSGCDHGKSTHDNGGWPLDEKSRSSLEGPCNIVVADSSLTQEQFLERYAFREPVVVQAASNLKFEDLCRQDVMLKDHGQKRIRLSSANTHSYKKLDVTLDEYVADFMKAQTLDRLGNETYYWFGDNNYAEWEELFASYAPPPYSLPEFGPAYSFGVAAAGTGVPFHFHGPGFAEVIYGRKRWFLYPPHKQPHFNPNKTTLHWLMEEYYRKPDVTTDLYECTIGPGQAIYFPDHWWHGTLNTDTSVFISTFYGPVN